jgi:hypothetical protein
VIREILTGSSLVDASEEIPVDQHNNVNPPPTPKDARKATEEQRQLQEELDHQGDDPDAPGLQQSWRQVADETRR